MIAASPVLTLQIENILRSNTTPTIMIPWFNNLRIRAYSCPAEFSKTDVAQVLREAALFK